VNIKRSLSSHQKYYLRQVCSGQTVIARSPTSGRYVWQAGADFVYTMDGSKARGKHARWGDHCRSSIIELRQRGFLVDDGEGRLVPSKEVAKQYGSPPPIPKPKRVVRMNRTRAAREQPKEAESCPSGSISSSSTS
jgi:hypothetical protein